MLDKENIKYQVFVSSTYLDLIGERKKITQAILEANCIPAGIENTTAIRTPRSWTQWCFSYFSCVFNAFTPCLTQSILDV